MAKRHYDVIVVGAGLAGLSAAQQLSLAGHRVVILEASNRLGGRIFADRIANIPVDLGADQVSRHHTNLLDLLQRYRINPLPADKFASISLNQTSLVNDKKIGFWKRRDRRSVLTKISRDLEEIRIDSPWSSPSAKKWDQQSFLFYLKKALFLRKNLAPLKAYFDQVFGHDIDAISTLDALFQLKIHGFLDVDRINNSHYPSGSLYRLVQQLGLEQEIKYQHPVQEITQHQRSVTVSGGFFQFRARYLIMAIPVHCLQDIKFSPSLSTDRNALWNQCFSSDSIRMSAIFDDIPFLRSTDPSKLKLVYGFQHLQYLQDPTGHVVLIGEIKGGEARKLQQMQTADRERFWRNTLKEIFGSEMADPLAMSSKRWIDEFWNCGNHTFRSIGAWTNYRNLLCQPEGRIYWAGAETSTTCYGTMEGAYISGLRAANEILAKSHAFHGDE